MKHLFSLTQLGFFKLLHRILWHPVSISVRLLSFVFLLKLLATSLCLPHLKIMEHLFARVETASSLTPSPPLDGTLGCPSLGFGLSWVKMRNFLFKK